MSLANLRETLSKLKMQREQQRARDTDTEEFTDTLDHRTWVKKIEQMGNPSNEWLVYTNHVSQYARFVSDKAREEFICSMYGKAIRAVGSTGTKNDSYARLFVNYAKFVSEMDEEDARDLYFTARTNLRRFAIVHIYSAQFEFQNGNKEKCRKILEKAHEMNAEPTELLDLANRNFLLGHQTLISDEDLSNFPVPKPTSSQLTQDLTESKLPAMNVSVDCGINVASGRTDMTDDVSKCDGVKTSRMPHRQVSHSDDETAPLGINLDEAFSRPSARKSTRPVSTVTRSNLIKPVPARRELIASNDPASSRQDGRLAAKITGGSNSSESCTATTSAAPNTSPTEVYLNCVEKRKREQNGAMSDECDTVPLAFDSNRGHYDRPLRSSHSTPDCKNASLMSVTLRKRRFVGQARRMLQPVREGSQNQPSAPPTPATPAQPPATPAQPPAMVHDDHTDGAALPPMPDLDASHTQEMTPSTLQKIDTCNRSINTLSSSGVAHKSAMDTSCLKSLTADHKPHTEISQVSQRQRHTSDTVKRATPSYSTNSQPAPQQAQPIQQQEDPPPPPPAPPVTEPPVSNLYTPVATKPEQPSNTLHQFTPSAKQQISIINGKQYAVLNCIGRGGTSSVYDVIDTDNNMRAVKMVDMRGADEATVLSYKNEIALLQRLQKSDRVITMFDYEFDARRNKLYVVMERGDTDLATVFARNKKLNEIKIMYYWQEMLEAVQVLHQEGIVHTDLKPANFLLVAGHLKLIDFGIAKAIQQDMTSVTTDQQVGTLNFMSPEALMADSVGNEVDEHGQLKRKHKIGYKSDVWSLGCILYRMVYGCTPFQTIRNQLQKMQAIINPRHPIKFPEIHDRHLWEVIKVCLVRNPAERPSIDDLLQHPYLTKPQNATPSPRPNTQAALYQLMQQFAAASPGSFSKVQENAQGLLAQMQGSKHMQENPFLNQAKKSNPNVRHISRAPLASVDPNEHQT